MFWRRKSSKTPALQRPDPLEPVHPRVLLAVYNPSCARRGGRLLVEVCGFNDPLALTRQYVDDLAELSGGYLRYQIVETLQVERFLPKVDGFCYDADDFLARWEGGGPWHEPDSADYHTILAQLDVPRRVAAGELDELWLMTMPYSGLWESAMAGRGAFFCNAPPIEGVD